MPHESRSTSRQSGRVRRLARDANAIMNVSSAATIVLGIPIFGRVIAILLLPGLAILLLLMLWQLPFYWLALGLSRAYQERFARDAESEFFTDASFDIVRFRPHSARHGDAEG